LDPELAGTVLFPYVRRLVRSWLALGARATGAPTPVALAAIMQNDTVLRLWQLFCAAVALGMWWYVRVLQAHAGGPVLPR
jgi:hypothetical protein